MDGTRRARRLGGGTGRPVALAGLCAAMTASLSLFPTTSAGARPVAPGQADGRSVSPSVSADGRYVAYASDATNLVLGDTNRAPDVFVRDRGTGRTDRASVGAGGQQAEGFPFGSRSPAISGDGNRVAFVSAAANLVPGNDNGAVDVFVRDRAAGTTTLVSANPAGRAGDGASDLPAISADGRWVAFVSAATDLVRADGNKALDVFVRDLTSSTTTRVSLDAAGHEVSGPCRACFGDDLRPALSADGNVVAFASPAPLVSADVNPDDDVFVRNRATATTELVSLDAAGTSPRHGRSGRPSVSSDGGVVAFESRAALVASDGNGQDDVYVADRSVHSVTWASAGAGRRGGTGDRPSVSADGRSVAFESRAPIAADDTNGKADVYRSDIATGSVTRLSVDTWYRRQGNADNIEPSVGANGTVVAFTTRASNLVPDDSNHADDVMVDVFDPARSVSFLGTLSIVAAVGATSPISTAPFRGQTLYRVWGGGSGRFGASWTPVDPRELGTGQYRFDTGLPDRLNTGATLTVGTLDDPASVVLVRAALPLNPNDTFGIPAFAVSGVTFRTYPGGLLEYIVPGAAVHILGPTDVVPPQPFGGPPPTCVPATRGCVGDTAP